MTDKKKKIRDILLPTLVLQMFAHESSDETLGEITDSFNDDIKKLEEQVKQSIIDEKISNDRYNKEQMKFRKRFYKK